jgi:hypothetical protein
MKFSKTQLIFSFISQPVTDTLLKIDRFWNRHVKNREERLGFDWGFLRYNSDLADMIKQFKKEIKWGLQRFVKGYDDTVMWGLDSYLDEITRISLRWYIKHRHGSPDFDGISDIHEYWTKELKKMLYHFEQSDDRWCKEKNEYSNTVDLELKKTEADERGLYKMEYKDTSPEAEALRNKWSERNREIESCKHNHHRQALELLVKYYDNLWD